MPANRKISKKTKKLIWLRICNALLIFGGIGLGLSVIWTGDDENRYWQGKAIGGAIAMIGLLIFLVYVIVVSTYKDTRDLSKIMPAIKDAFLTFLSFKPTWKTSRKTTRRK